MSPKPVAHCHHFIRLTSRSVKNVARLTDLLRTNFNSSSYKISNFYKYCKAFKIVQITQHFTVFIKLQIRIDSTKIHFIMYVIINNIYSQY